MNGESAGPALLAARFVQSTLEGKHIPAVKAQVEVSLEIFKAVLVCCSQMNGIAATALSRTLFDATISASILAKHPDKLNDFVRHGRFMHLRMLRFISTLPPAMKKRNDEQTVKTEAEWKILFNEFNHKEWHKLGTKDAFKEAEYPEYMYDKFFRPASAYAHAEPYIVVHPNDDDLANCVVAARKSAWKNHAIATYNFSCYAMLHMVAILSREFRLGYENEIEVFALEAKKYEQRHMAAIKGAFDEHYGSAAKEGPSANER